MPQPLLMGPAPAAALSATQHNYPTRVREPSRPLKQSPRLRLSVDDSAASTSNSSSPTPASRAKLVVPKSHPPSQSSLPVFPPPNIMLHPDDANSKVFLAIGRAFLSVENRAMTIKDLADMTIKCGFVCQNVSAASQAITTYVRSHMSRCDTQGDHPLLLRHTLSGTASDDDLHPALYSLTGGANLQGTSPATAKPDHRKTWFRRGTTVWFLSKATGATCPFTRAGINLAEYGEQGRNVAAKMTEPNQKEIEQAGHKRKRALRGSVINCTEVEQEDQPAKPAKVRLTLKLKPPTPPNASCEIIDLSKDTEADRLTDDREDCQEGSGLPPYPRRSIDIPCYTPSYEGSYPPYPIAQLESSPPKMRWHRSPSIPHSVASLGSLPPDSDEEMFSVEASLHFPYRARPEQDSDDDDDDDSLRWESPGPNSPLAVTTSPRVRIADTNELAIMSNALARWDFDMDHHLATLPSDLHDPSKSESAVQVTHEWLSPFADSPDLIMDTKEEEDLSIRASFETLTKEPQLSLASSPIASTPASPVFNRSGNDSRQTSPEVVWKDVEVLGPDTVDVRDFDDGAWEESPIKQRSKSTSSLPSLSEFTSVEPKHAYSDSNISTVKQGQSHSSVHFIDTSLPSFPIIRATSLEGVPVYQMSLGDACLLRRVDTNYVNISTLVDHLGVSQPLATAQVTIVTEGSSSIRGIWVPLVYAQWFAREHASACRLVGKFLSDNLEDHFPSSLKCLMKSSLSPCRQRFGAIFESTAEARKGSLCSEEEDQSMWTPDPAEDHKPAASEPDAETVKSLKVTGAYVLEPREVNQPLTKQEQEVFQEFMVGYASPKETPIDLAEPLPLPTASETLTASPPKGAQPLRRSKRHTKR